jgi:RNA polymerase sigma factor (sigma-70 family)
MQKEEINKEGCYEQKIELIRRPLLRYIKSCVFDFSECEDILQNTLLIIFNKRNEYNSSKNFYNWSFSICRFQIKAYLSKKKRNREHSSGTLTCGGIMNHFHESYISCFSFPFQDIIKKDRSNEMSKKVRSISHKLSDKENKFLNYSCEGLNKDQVKSKMNISDNYYNTLRSRTISKCKNLIIKLNTENVFRKKIK